MVNGLTKSVKKEVKPKHDNIHFYPYYVIGILGVRAKHPTVLGF